MGARYGSAKPTEVREGDLLSGVHNICISTLLSLLFFPLKTGKGGLISSHLYIASNYLHLFHLACMVPERLLTCSLLKSKSAAVSEIIFL